MVVELDFTFDTLYLGKIPETDLKKDKYLLKILLASSTKAITLKMALTYVQVTRTP